MAELQLHAGAPTTAEQPQWKELPPGSTTTPLNTLPFGTTHTGHSPFLAIHPFLASAPTSHSRAGQDEVWLHSPYWQLLP